MAKMVKMIQESIFFYAEQNPQVQCPIWAKLSAMMFVEGKMKWCDRVDGEHLNAESEESTIEESVEQKHLTCRQTD